MAKNRLAIRSRALNATRAVVEETFVFIFSIGLNRRARPLAAHIFRIGMRSRAGCLPGKKSAAYDDLKVMAAGPSKTRPVALWRDCLQPPVLRRRRQGSQTLLTIYEHVVGVDTPAFIKIVAEVGCVCVLKTNLPDIEDIG